MSNNSQDDDDEDDAHDPDAEPVKTSTSMEFHTVVERNNNTEKKECTTIANDGLDVPSKDAVSEASRKPTQIETATFGGEQKFFAPVPTPSAAANQQAIASAEPSTDNNQNAYQVPEESKDTPNESSAEKNRSSDHLFETNSE